MADDAMETILDYREATKHHLNRFAGGPEEDERLTTLPAYDGM